MSSLSGVAPAAGARAAAVDMEAFPEKRSAYLWLTNLSLPQ
jgi:hypothetical protein